MTNYPTPHISGEPGDYGKTVLMPGDPLRSRFIAENYLKDARLVNNIRGVQGYTGTYRGETISVMASNMGMPSMGIYSYELYNFFEVERIIRVGTTGAISPDVKLRDIVIALGASYSSYYADQYHLPGTYSATADFDMLCSAVQSASRHGYNYHVGNILSSDIYYDDRASTLSRWAKMGILSVEMETAALYMNAARAGKKALTVLTVSNHIITGEDTTPAERERSFGDMVVVALECADVPDEV